MGRGIFVVAVTGGRNFENKQFVFDVLDAYHAKLKVQVVVHGAAKGVDTYANWWADKNAVFQCQWPVTGGVWSTYGAPAGPIRSNYFLKLCRPDVLLAFPGARGTKGCVGAATKMQIPVRFHIPNEPIVVNLETNILDQV